MYTKTLIIGATSGIGWGLASALVAKGTHVVLVGRRSEKLEAFRKEHPNTANLISTITFDITSLASIPDFAQKVTSSHPDLDTIILNSGIQRAFDFASPSGLSTSELASLTEETTTNYTAYLHLTAAFLPHLLKSSTPTSIIYISATLALCPGLYRTLNYNASKAALHTFILNLREQLNESKEQGTNKSVPKIIEVFPPAVQTELHDEKHQPDLINGGEIGIPLKVFVDATVETLGAQNVPDEFTVGNDGKVGEVMEFEKERQKRMKAMAKVVMSDSGLKKYLRKKE